MLSPTAAHRLAGSARLLAALLALLVTAALALARLAPPAPREPAQGEFSATRARGDLARLVGDGAPHPVGSSAASRARGVLLEALRGAGWSPSEQRGFACSEYGVCASVVNVVARREGREPGKAVLLAAHYDSVPAGPGASDDGSGVAAVLEIARVLASLPPTKNTIIVLVDEGEEDGLLGARAFFAGHPWAREVGALVNLDARGTSGPSLMFENGDDDAWILERLSTLARIPSTSSVFTSVYKRLPNGTDFTVFARAGISGANFAFIGDPARYHTRMDRLDQADLSTLQGQGDNALGATRVLAESDLVGHSRGGAVFFDVLRLVVVRFGVSLAAPLAWLALAATLAATALSVRRGHLTLRGLGVASLAWLVSAVLSVACAFGLFVLARALGAYPASWVAHPGPSRAAFVLLPFAVTSALSALSSRVLARAFPRLLELVAASWLVWAVAGVGAAIALPGASYLLVVPALTAGAFGLALGWRARVEASPPSALAWTLAGAVPATLLAAPLMTELDVALGARGFPIEASLATLLALHVAPLAREAARPFAVPACLGAVAIALGLAGVLAPAFSAESPLPVNLELFVDADARTATYAIEPRADVVPPPLRAKFDQRPPELLVGTKGATFARAAAGVDPASFAPPEAVVTSRADDGPRSRLRLHVRSPRGAPSLTLVFPADARVDDLRVQGEPMATAATRARYNGLLPVTCDALPADGVDVELTLSGNKSFTLTDSTPGLPAAAADLEGARGPLASPIHRGDSTTVARRISL